MQNKNFPAVKQNFFMQNRIYTPLERTCATVLSAMRKGPENHAGTVKNREYQFEMSDWGEAKLREKTHILGESQRKQKIRIST